MLQTSASVAGEKRGKKRLKKKRYKDDDPEEADEADESEDGDGEEYVDQRFAIDLDSDGEVDAFVIKPQRFIIKYSQEQNEADEFAAKNPAAFRTAAQAKERQDAYKKLSEVLENLRVAILAAERLDLVQCLLPRRLGEE